MGQNQNVKADFKKINEVYNNTPTFAMDIKYELYLDGSSVAYETELGKYIKHQNMYYTLQANNEVIITNTYMFLIDKTAKVLAVDKKIDENKIANPLSLNLDSLFVLYSKIEILKSNSDDIKGYRFYIKQGPYLTCDVFVNSKTNFVTEIRNVFREKIVDENDKLRSAVLKTTFYNIIEKLPTSRVLFDNSKYIKLLNQKYVLSENYKSYKFINHLN